MRSLFSDTEIEISLCASYILFQFQTRNWLTTWGRWILQRIQQIHSRSQSSQTSTRWCHRPLKLCTSF